jgi:hypothetical protein
MPDWEKLVSDRLAQLALDEDERQDVIAELAGHLEEIYEGLRQKGASRDEAVRDTLLQVENWNKLRNEIYVARTRENIMNARTRRFWIPSLVTLAASIVTLIGFTFLGLGPGPLGVRPEHTTQPEHEIWWGHLVGGITGITGGPHAVNEYTVWLMALPLIGALGAGLSRRAGGTLRDIVISGVFPALAWLTITLIVLSFAASLGRGLEVVTAPVGAVGLIAVLVLIPGGCLLLGVLVYHVVAKLWTKSAA